MMIHSNDTRVTNQSKFVGNCGWKMGGFSHPWRGHKGHPSKVAEGNSLVCACIQRYLKKNQKKNKKARSGPAEEGRGEE